MSQAFFADLAIPEPQINLGIGSASHGAQTGAMLAALEEVFLAERPDWVLVYGDTNTTLAAALAAVKIHQPVAHLEAGLRSFNRRMPEEHNRVLTDHAADLLLAPTEVAMEHLRHEGLGDLSQLVGDVMTDVCYRVADSAVPSWRLQPPPADGYFLATIHRPANTDEPDRLRGIVQALADLPGPVRLAAHPRLRAKATDAGIDLAAAGIEVCDPLPYPELVAAVIGARGVVTDSGGLQKEAYLLGRPCTTVRPETEWVETLADGWNLLAPDAAQIVPAASRPTPTSPRTEPYGDGHAATRVATALADSAI
jgi:UDP-N-acetylglucosamine 2-epimerase (non-hydrolysing)